MTKGIELTISWRDALPALLMVYEHAEKHEGKMMALKELQRMASLADDAFKPLEIGLYPMCVLENGDHILAGSRELVRFYDVDVRPEGSDPIFEADGLTEEAADALVRELEVQYPHASVNDLRELF